jgi:uncharacterized protein DUF3667
MGVMPAPLERVARTVQERLRPPEARSESCLNCDAPLSGPFCAQCGQRDIPPYPSSRELLVDAFWELSGWDGRFASTARELVRHPGGLTRKFLAGRRARYISPLRLYLMASLVYFLVAAVVPHDNSAKSKVASTAVGGMEVSATTSRPRAVAEVAGAAIAEQRPISPAQRDSILREVNRAPALLRPFLRRSLLDPVGLKKGMLEAMPRALFALVPVFAAIVALFYRRRRYPEHLYFAIHLHAFTFLALTLLALAKITRLPFLVSALQLAVLIWIPTYATLSFRRVYGGSMVATLAKEAGIAALYGLAGMVALVATIYVVALGA